MPYTKTEWNEGIAPGISAANLNNLETQYDEAYADGKTYTDEQIVLANRFTELWQSLTDPSSGAWTDSDLSLYIPTGTKAVEIAIGTETSGTGIYTVGCRKNGSSLQRKIVLKISTTADEKWIMMTCEVGADRIVELFSDAPTYTHHYLVGYWK